MSGILGSECMSEETALEIEDAALYNTIQKWYVRRKWLDSALARKRKNAKDHIKYLTLTSINLYDIKFLEKHGLIQKNEVGYDKDSMVVCESSLERAIQIRNRLPGVYVFHGRIQDFLSVGTSNLREDIRKRFPFDVINLDITGAPFTRNQQLVSTIEKIFHIQKWYKYSFTLFITICSEEEGQDEDTKSNFQMILNDNLRDPEFKDEFINKYPTQNFNTFHEYFSFVLGKLVIEKGNSYNFKIKCGEKCSYIGEGRTNRMVSFVFENEYIDETGAIRQLSNIRFQRILDILVRECDDVNHSLSIDDNTRKKCRSLVEEYS
jgi:hypothetical protein